MRSWEDICQEFIGIGDDVAKLRTFVNTTLGESFEEKGWAPRPERIKARNAEDYHVGQLPETARPLLLTAGTDVQDDRLAVEVVAWGRDMESWSITYVEIPGDTSDLTSEAWKGLHALLYAKHAGFALDAVLIDEGGHRTEQVRHFCEDFGPGVHAVKGDSWRRGSGIFSRRDIPGHDRQIIMLNVDALKEVVYGSIIKGTADGKPPRDPFPGFCHFPFDYDESYYKMLAAEERFLDRGRDGQKIMRWRKVHTRNEALDCRVYGLGALYVFFDDWRRGVTKEDETEQAHGWSEFWGVGEQRQRERETANRGRKV
jgi:phage terminase large subunit GpA-like protein